MDILFIWRVSSMILSLILITMTLYHSLTIHSFCKKYGVDDISKKSIYKRLNINERNPIGDTIAYIALGVIICFVPLINVFFIANELENTIKLPKEHKSLYRLWVRCETECFFDSKLIKSCVGAEEYSKFSKAQLYIEDIHNKNHLLIFHGYVQLKRLYVNLYNPPIQDSENFKKCIIAFNKMFESICEKNIKHNNDNITNSYVDLMNSIASDSHWL